MEKHFSLRKLLALIVSVLGIGAGMISPFVAAPSEDVNKIVGIEEQETAMGNAAESTTAEEDVNEYTRDIAEEVLQEGVNGVIHVHTIIDEVITEPTCMTGGEVRHYCGCGYEYTEILFPTGHTAGEWEDVSETQRALRCTICGETLGSETKEAAQDADAHHHIYDGQVDKEATCTTAGEMLYTCSCGSYYKEAIPVIAHSYTVEERKEPTCREEGSLIKKCDACGHEMEAAIIEKLPHDLDEGNVVIEATCTTNGQKEQICSVCNEVVKSIIPATGHGLGEYSITKDAGCEENGLKEATCQTCGANVEEVIPATGHSFVCDSIIDATCNDDGVKVFKCENCNQEKREVISAKGHEPGDWVVTVKPTCTTGGERQRYCETCQSVVETEEISATGHSYGEWVEDIPATCETEGSRHRICENCQNVENEVVQALGHDEGDWVVVKEATDLETGHKEKTCQNCGKLLESQEIPKLPHTHSYENETARVDADCENTGSVTLECRCGDSITQTLDALGHEWSETDKREADCTMDGYVDSECTRCHQMQHIVLDAFGHNPGEWVVVKEATDLEEGIEEVVCQTCGATIDTRTIAKLEHVHDYSLETEKMDATCTTDGFVVRQCRCGETEKETISATGHEPGEWVIVKEPSYTELGTKEQHCIECGTLINTESIDIIPHEHDYEEVINENAGCVTKGNKTLTCKVCGDIQTEEIPATGHTENWVTVKEPTCDANGSKELQCSVCGNVSDIQNIDALGHSASDWIVDSESTCTANGHQHKNCIRCGAEIESSDIVATGHSFGGFEVTKEPTCTEAGEQTKACGNCGETVSVSIDPKGHDYGDWIMDTEPTEENGGERHKECSNCGDIITEEIDPLPRHDHDFVESVRTDASCTQEGSVSYSCTICGEGYSESIPMKSHTPGDWETKTMATETTTGLRVKKCTVCGNEVESEIIEKIPHVHAYEESTVDATCVNDGYTEFTCRCGDSYKEIIKATGHSYVVSERKEATCTESGFVKTTCENCQDVIVETIEKIPHNYVEIKKTEPTCGKKGEIVTQCSICKDEKTSEIDALEHKYEITNTVDPTCTADGYVENTCSLCGDVKTEENGTATGHDFGEWETTKEPALGEDGEKTSTCSNCGEVMTEKIDMLMTDGVDNVYFVELSDGSQRMVIGHFDEAAAQEIYELVNEHRAEVGSAPLTVEDFQEETDRRALEIAILYEHVRPTNRPMNFGENIVEGKFSMSAYEMYDAWLGSDGHRTNMEKADYKYSAVSVFHLVKATKGTKKLYYSYGVQTFGRRTMDYYMSF